MTDFLEGRRQSTNVEDARGSTGSNRRGGFLEWVHELITGGSNSKQTGPAPFPDFPTGRLDKDGNYIGPDTTELRRTFGTMNNLALSASTPEVRNLYTLRNNPEAFDGYLHDLDSRGIHLSLEPNKAGTFFNLGIHDRDFFGNRIPEETLAQSRQLLADRQSQAATPEPGVGLGAGLSGNLGGPGIGNGRRQ